MGRNEDKDIIDVMLGMMMDLLLWIVEALSKLAWIIVVVVVVNVAKLLWNVFVWAWNSIKAQLNKRKECSEEVLNKEKEDDEQELQANDRN